MIMDFHGRFGFHRTPFTRELAVDQRFALPFCDEALLGLLRAIEHCACAALCAPAGTGKTALVRALCQQLPEARYRVHYVKVADSSKRDLCREIAVACNIAPVGSYPVLMRRLQERFAAQASTDGTRPVLVLDEAHDLRPEVLDMMRILTNFEMDGKLVLSVILIGQPKLRLMLRRDDQQAMLGRLAHVASLRLLGQDESNGYLAHRCHIAGAVTVPFNPQAKIAIFEMARGNLRATDQLALKALEVAHDNDKATVDANHVVSARAVLQP